MKRKDVINQYGKSAFDGKVGGYIGISVLQVLVIYLCAAIGIVAFYFINNTFGMITMEEETISIVKDQILYLILGFAAISFFMMIGVAWGHCIALKWTLKHTVIGGFRLYFDGKAVQLFGNYLKWFFLILITVGIYSFWTPIKYKQWEVKHTKIDNSVENAPIGNPEFICPPVYVQPMMSQFPYQPNGFGCPYKNNKN